MATVDPDGPVVVGVDGSEHADRALRWAVREAQLRHAPLEVVSAVETSAAALLRGRSTASAAGVLESSVERHADLLATVPWTSSPLDEVAGGVADALVAAARDAQLLVVGSRGLGGFAELLFGSTSHRVVIAAACPVAVVRRTSATDEDGLRELVVGADDDEASLAALRWAFTEAQRRHVRVLVVHGLDLPDDAALVRYGVSVAMLPVAHEQARADAAERIDALIDKARPLRDEIAVDRVIVRGAPTGALLHHAGAERLLVVGSHGRRARERFALGSVSHQCVHHARGPVVVVPDR